MRCDIQCVKCHMGAKWDDFHNFCDGIDSAGVTIQMQWLWYQIEWVRFHIYHGCNIVERVGVRNRYSGCDGTNIVIMLLYTMDMILTCIEDEIS